MRLCVHRCLQAVMHGGHTDGLYMPRQGWYFCPVSAVSSIMVVTGRLLTVHHTSNDWNSEEKFTNA